jgi:hypothetical protein
VLLSGDVVHAEITASIAVSKHTVRGTIRERVKKR